MSIELKGESYAMRRRLCSDEDSHKCDAISIRFVKVRKSSGNLFVKKAAWGMLVYIFIIYLILTKKLYININISNCNCMLCRLHELTAKVLTEKMFVISAKLQIKTSLCRTQH